MSREQAQTGALVYQVSLRATCFIITYYCIERFHAGAAGGQAFTSLCLDPADVSDTKLRHSCKRGPCVYVDRHQSNPVLPLVDRPKHSVLLFGLRDRCRLDLCAEDTVPELAGDTEAVLVVEEVVLKVVFLELLVPERQILVMQEVVCHVVARVAEHAAREHSHGNEPVPVEEEVCQFPEWRNQHQKERGRHDEPVLVHRQVVVDTVQGEMQCDTDSVVRKVAETPIKTVKEILNERPDEEAQYQEGRQVVETLEALGGRVDAEGHAGPPDQRDNPPRRLAEGLEEVSKERRGLSAFVVPGAVDLVEIELLAEAAEPHLREEGLVEVEEFVLLVVFRIVRLLVQVFLGRHARPRVNPLTICGTVAVGVAVRGVFEHLIGSLGVIVGVRVLEDCRDVLPSPVEHEVGAAGVGVEKICDIVDVVANSDIAGLCRAVCLDVGAREERERCGVNLGVLLGLVARTRKGAEWSCRQVRLLNRQRRVALRCGKGEATGARVNWSVGS
ncbi:hypothetical protein FJTKL_03761 [Diaporthe vaccinii]|uniref:Uncharacterized protein n=1 Tax=Diaporthe vaccinii TaxID=105482 RepID=A0ABR4DX45_9PEZI